MSPAAILISATVAIMAIVATFLVNKRNRRIRATIDLYLTYYGKEFTESRYALYQYLIEKENESGLKRDFRKWFSKARETKNAQAIEMQVILSRLAAFFQALRQLIDSKEIDERIAERLFRLTYSYWNMWRKRFHAESPDSIKYLFEPISLFSTISDIDQHNSRDTAKSQPVKGEGIQTETGDSLNPAK